MSVMRSLFSRSFLLLTALILLPAPHAKAQKGMVGPAVAPESAKHYSYVFLDPLEGQHSTAPNSGDHVGVEMHGHWVIDVKNPDGTIAEHRDFENTLYPGFGSEYLTALLAGTVVPSDYAIFVQPNSGSSLGPCAPLNGSTLQGCGLVRSLVTLPGSGLCQYYFCATSLSYLPTVSDSGGANSFTMAGTFTANQAGSITNVQTLYGSCPNTPASSPLATVTPAACSSVAGSGGYRVLTYAAITQVNVVVSQIVQVTVTITFS